MPAQMEMDTARKNAISTPWRETEDKALKHMRIDLKLSYAEMARRLPGRTRSAIMHRISRLGLVDNSTAEQYASGWREYEDNILRASLADGLNYKEIARLLNRTRNACIGRANRIGLIAPMEKKREPLPLPGPAGMPMPTRKTCAWPMGHPGEDGFHFCGAEPVTDRPYCDAHCRKAYTNYGTEVMI